MANLITSVAGTSIPIQSSSFSFSIPEPHHLSSLERQLRTGPHYLISISMALDLNRGLRCVEYQYGFVVRLLNIERGTDLERDKVIGFGSKRDIILLAISPQA